MHVYRSADHSFISSYRVGTITTDEDAYITMVNHFGQPDEINIDDKVSFCYYFLTPRGRVEVRDYWWNAPNELSIAATNKKAGMWVAAYFRSLGYSATTRERI